jgi:hypothetical protein
MTTTTAEIASFERFSRAAARSFASKLAAFTDEDGAFAVVLASRGNPDMGQDERRALPGVKTMIIRVATLDAASSACRLYIEHHDLGGGNWTGGEVKSVRTKDVVAKVSYNGRVWNPGAWPTAEIVGAALEARS